MILCDAPWDSELREYQYPESTNELPKFNFLDNVRVTDFCVGSYLHESRNTSNPTVRKIIELYPNDQPDRIFTIISRTRLHIGKLERDYEYEDFGGIVAGQTYLNTERWFTVYVLSAGFGTSYRALAEHISRLEVTP